MYTLTPRSPPRTSTRPQAHATISISLLGFCTSSSTETTSYRYSIPSLTRATRMAQGHHAAFSRWGLQQARPPTAPPHPSLRSHRKHDKLQLHLPPVSLRLILCVLKHKAQPRAIFPVQSQPWVSRMPCFLRRRERPLLSYYCLGCQAVRVNRAGHLRYRSACTACPISTPDREETP